MGRKRGGYGCCAFGCKKRKMSKLTVRSDSDGSADEETVAKKKFPRTFHCLPMNEEKRKQWLIQIHREGWVPGHHARICSDHFRECDLDRTGCTVRIRENAVPTRFKKFPKNLRKVVESCALLPGKLPVTYPEIPVPSQKISTTLSNAHQATVKNGCESSTITIKQQPSDSFTQSTTNQTDESPQSVNGYSPTYRSKCSNEHCYIDYRYSLFDHDYTSHMSPGQLRQQLHAKDKEVTKVKKKLKTAQQKCRRLTARVTRLKQIVKEFRQNGQTLSKLAPKTETLSEIPSMAIFDSPGCTLVDELLDLESAELI